MGSCQSGSCSHGPESPDDVRLRDQLKRIQNKLLIMSGKGGVGKSSVATYLAHGLARLGHRVGLLDVDLHGPSIPRMLGVSGIFHIGEDKRMLPHAVNDRLQVVSIECLLEDRDSAVIWRGPVKHGVIRQFIADVDWGELDYLIIDSPPGTGDEPISIAQTIPDAHAVIVTTPQEISLADVRKSINFCRHVHMPILGLVENMSGFICPHCSQETPILGKGGGARTAEAMNVHLLGSLPFEPRVVQAGDVGRTLFESPDGSHFMKALEGLITQVMERCATLPGKAEQEARTVAVPDGDHTFKVAVPLAEGRLTNHFGHCEQFAIVDVHDGKIDGKEIVTPPPHEPGLLPRWLGERGVSLILAGGMGQRALHLFSERNIHVVTGAPNLEPEELIRQYLAGELTTGANVCDH
ncbi:MAG: P-loop NTPase [Syntrophobacteraceae bacterium]|jgi:Mrp family chromosome partitioning ATPase/predicted Fe-Mo cluster-binding NifX family protein|nr:P-loop NTPase [Syntrophobacteraceae bacterium]